MKNSKTQTIVLSSLYFSGILSYNIFTLYSNSVEQLIEYRKTKQYFKNDLDAIITGCQKNWFDNLLLSLFWPIRLPFKLIPIVILYFNSNDSNKNNSFIQYEVKKCINIKNINDTKKYIKTIDKIKNDKYESNKENTEYVKELNEEDIQENKEESNEETLESKEEKLESIQENKEETLESIKENKDENNEENKPIFKNENKEISSLNELNKDLDEIVEAIDEKFNFGNFNQELLFDFTVSQ